MIILRFVTDLIQIITIKLLIWGVYITSSYDCMEKANGTGLSSNESCFVYLVDTAPTLSLQSKASLNNPSIITTREWNSTGFNFK